MMSRVVLRAALCVFLLLAFVPLAARGEDVAALLAQLRAVGPHGKGSVEAREAWATLADMDADHLPQLLAAVDDANPLAANWIRTAVDAIAERVTQGGGELPVAALERFLNQPEHAPRARRQAYEWIVRVDPEAEQRLLEGLLDDPSVELRRDAVDRWIRRGEALVKQSLSSEAADVFARAFQASRDRDQVELLAERLKKLNRPVDLLRHFGFLVRWRVIGPFDNADEKGFDAVYPPEKEISFHRDLEGKEGTVAWVAHVTRDDNGKVDFHAVIGEQKEVCAYAATTFVSPAELPAELRVQTSNAVKVWLNGAPVAAHNIYHSGDFFDQYVAAVNLRKGENQILVKVCQNAQTDSWARKWQFFLRVCDATGGAIHSTDGGDDNDPISRILTGDGQ